MTPIRRVRRVLRWIHGMDGRYPPRCKHSGNLKAKSLPVIRRDLARYHRANALFAAELEWLCKEATQYLEEGKKP